MFKLELSFTLQSMTAFRADGIEELAREYQDYVIAHRVRRLLGGRLEPKAFLTIPEYAQKRMKRQQIAREIVTVKPFTTERLRIVDELTDELCFGMWRNPREINDFLRAVWRIGGHSILEHPSAFVAQVLLPHEIARLPEGGLEVARLYHACLTLGAAALSPDEMELAAQRVDAAMQAVPLYLEEFVSSAA
jgi:hypothetical protein